MSSVAADLWKTIARDASEESSLWRDALRSDAEQEPVFSPLGEDRFALGLETIYEGYLVHYGSPRLFAPPDADTALLLGDYLDAHGLVRIASFGEVGAVGDLSELISFTAAHRECRQRQSFACHCSAAQHRQLDGGRAALASGEVGFDTASRAASGDGPSAGTRRARRRFPGDRGCSGGTQGSDGLSSIRRLDSLGERLDPEDVKLVVSEASRGSSGKKRHSAGGWDLAGDGVLAFSVP